MLAWKYTEEDVTQRWLSARIRPEVSLWQQSTRTQYETKVLIDTLVLVRRNVVLAKTKSGSAVPT